MTNNTTYKQTEIGEIPEDWEVKRLSDILAEKGYIRGPFGSSLLRSELKSEGVPVYEQQHVIDSHRNFRYFIDNTKFRELSRFTVKKDDLLISCSGTLGKVSIITKDDPIGIISQALLILRPDIQKILPLLLKYFFTSNLGFGSLASLSSGSVQINLAKREIIENLLLPLPPIDEQAEIIKVLTIIDDKVELNRKMNKALEEIGKALFKRWFVDFEFPFDFAQGKPNLDDKPYKSSGGKMVDSELGEIPEGWKIGELAEEFSILMGQSPPGNTYNNEGDGLPFYQGRTDFGDRYPTKRIYCSVPARVAKPNDTLLSVRAPVGDINQANEKCCIGRGVAAISKDGYYSYTFYKILYLKHNFQTYDQEGTVFGSITKDDLSKIPIVIPQLQIVRKYEDLLEEIDKQIYLNSLQINKLTNLRDSILPRLMTGKLRIKGYEN